MSSHFEPNRKTKVPLPSAIVYTFGLAVGILFVISVWLFFITPKFLTLPQDFRYDAEIFSVDNFYDEKTQTFAGGKRSITSFSFEVVDEESDSFIVKNVFDVRTITGDTIFTVERLYGIDPKTRKHISGRGDRSREGYLFAPRHLKKGQPFTYWHINYDGPARMNYVNEETLYGLRVYHYESRYEGVNIDQTVNLGYLPNVPETRGINIDPYLQLWIEPITGHLIKYKDESTAYYYNIFSGRRLVPWNKFTNRYTEDSVRNHVESAKQEKINLLFIERIIPIFLAIIASSLFLIAFSRKKTAMVVFSVGILGIIGYFGSIVYADSIFNSKHVDSIQKLRVSGGVGPHSSPIYVASEKGFFKQQGVEITFREHISGKVAIESLLKGEIELATTAEAPIMFAAARGDNVKIVATIMSSDKDLAIIARKDKNIFTRRDLRSKNIGVTKGTNSEFFAGILLNLAGIKYDEVTMVNLKSEEMYDALISGKVDAVSTWNPYSTVIQKKFGDRVVIFGSRGVYTETYNIVSQEETLRAHSESVKRFIKALIQASEFIENNQEESQAIVAKYTETDKFLVREFLPFYDFNIGLDQSLILNLEDTTKWAVENKLIDIVTEPNYLDFIYFDALESIKPEAVTIVYY